MNRWAINIDIEGFGCLWSKEIQVLKSLGDLMDGIYQIGSKCYPNSPNRLFAHQIGDGFIIVSEFGDSSMDIPISIAIALMRHVVAKSNRYCKATIAEGDFADISGCYPEIFRQAEKGEIRMGDGVMTIVSVMGTALINAVSIGKDGPSGCFVVLRSKDRDRISSTLQAHVIKVDKVDEKADEFISVDWIHAESETISRIQREAGLCDPNAHELEDSFRKYCESMTLKDAWKSNSFKYLKIPPQNASLV